jgi:anti-anti-sigma regulatory factor
MVQYREKALSQRDLEEWALSCLDQNSERKREFERGEKDDFHSEQFEAAASAAAAILEGLNAQRGVVKGRLRISREGTITIVRVNDVYLVEDAELALIKHELHEHLDQPNLRVLIDMKNVKRMSSQAAEMFSHLRTWLRPKGSRLAFCRLRPEFEQMLRAYPVSQDMPMFGEKPKALAAKW